jgi:hypothetical protein
VSEALVSILSDVKYTLVGRNVKGDITRLKEMGLNITPKSEDISTLAKNASVETAGTLADFVSRELGQYLQKYNWTFHENWYLFCYCFCC